MSRITKTVRIVFALMLAILANHALAANVMWGVTSTNPWKTNATANALAALAKRPTVRIVFDEFVAAAEYGDIPRRFHEVAFTMGEILDSAYVDRYSVRDYRARVIEYLAAFRNDIDIWEIANEVNGEWLGNTTDVVHKMSGAYDLVKADGGKTAITLYLNEGCWERPQNEMFAWAAANIPQYIKDGVDYVFVSYYEDDCNGRQPNWQAVFERLGAMFPNSLLGVGECGTTKRARKEEYLRRYYTMRINHPRYVGGHFWWYFNQDMVPSTTKPLWHTLDELMRAP